MSCRAVPSVVAAVMLGIACVSTDAFAYRGGVRAGRVGAPGMHSAGVYLAALIAAATVIVAGAWVPQLPLQQSAQPPSVQR